MGEGLPVFAVAVSGQFGGEGQGQNVLPSRGGYHTVAGDTVLTVEKAG